MNLEDHVQKKVAIIWEKEKNYWRYNFGLRLTQYAYGKHFDYTTTLLPNSYNERSHIIENYRKRSKRGSSRDKQFNRLLIGYYGSHINLTPKKCGLYSEKSFGKPIKETTNDHVIGVTTCSEFVLQEFKKEIKDWKDIVHVNKVVEYMSNEWLPKHLWLWAQCKITREEHNPSNLSRGDSQYTLEQKKNLEHYKAAGIVIKPK